MPGTAASGSLPHLQADVDPSSTGSPGTAWYTAFPSGPFTHCATLASVTFGIAPMSA